MHIVTQRKLKCAIQNKWNLIMLLHNNAWSHTTDEAAKLLQEINWEIFDHHLSYF